MKGRFKVPLMLGMILAAAGGLLGAIGPVAAQLKELPAGPNRDLVSQQCQACHDLDNVLEGAGASREAWDGAIEQMVGFGMMVTAEQRAIILDYLATYLGPGAGANPPSAAGP
jgi:mono/diheme cytochrome c family protein